MDRTLKFAIGNVDRITPLKAGKVRPNGFDFEIIHNSYGSLFQDITQKEKYEITEMSMASYVIWKSKGTCPYIGIPVFPSRTFRHSAIYINNQSNIHKPKDLENKRIGILPEYQSTSATTIRGFLSNFYDVDIESVDWFTEKKERMPINVPDYISIEQIGKDEELEQQLIRGNIDALFSTKIPDLDNKNIGRLFKDYKEEEKRYFEQTGYFPIMHTVLIHSEIYDKNPWVAEELYNVLLESKEFAFDDLYDTDSLKVMLPWLMDHIEETRNVLGNNFWQYGFENNVSDIQRIANYCKEQHLSKKAMDPDDLFLPIG